MSESNNVKFVEADGKWLWKRYDINGSVIFRSPEFNTEREAREDYDVNGDEVQTSTDTSSEAGPVGGVTTAPAESNTIGSAAPEGDLNAGTTAPSQESQPGADAGLVS